MQTGFLHKQAKISQENVWWLWDKSRQDFKLGLRLTEAEHVTYRSQVTATLNIYVWAQMKRFLKTWILQGGTSRKLRHGRQTA